MAASTRSPRLCISSAYYPPHMGGVEVFTQSIAHELAGRGIGVCVVTDGVDGCGIERAADGVEVIRMPAADPTGRFPLLARGSEAQRLWGDLAARDFDACVVNTRFYPLSLRMLELARRRDARPILIEHGSSYLSLGNPALDLGIHAYEHAIGARIRALGPACYGVSREACEWLSAFGLAARGTIHNSIDTAAFRAMSSGRDFRAEQGIPPDACLVAFTGRIIAEKGIWTLVDAARLLEKEPFYFIVAGDGPELGRLRARKPSNLKAVGRLSRADVSALLAQADIFCFPSSYPEGLPTSLLEATSAGAFIVTTPVGGAREIVPGPDYGRIVPDAGYAGIARAIVDAWSQPSLMRARARRCAERVEREFSWPKAADDLLAACGIDA